MSLSFATPLAALLSLVGLAPLVAFRRASRRSAEVSAALALPRSPRRLELGHAVALSAIAGLLGLAAAQPTLAERGEQRVRTDAQAWFVLDVSRSMAASQSADAPARLERAKSFAARLRAQLPGVPVGVATLADRVLPHLFPSPDAGAFAQTVEHAIGIERPPPFAGDQGLITTFDPLVDVPGKNYFPPTARRRLLVVFTDGESLPLAETSFAHVFRRPPGVGTLFIHVSDRDERIHLAGNRVDRGYEPVSNSGVLLEALAATIAGRVISERDFGAAAEVAREVIGAGPTRIESHTERSISLAPYVAALALLPLGFVLVRRNL